MTTTPHQRADATASGGPVRTAVTFGAVAATVLAGSWFVAQPGRSAAPTEPAALRPLAGQTAPGFEARTTSGEPVSLGQLRGRAVWLTFGATWCADCRSEAPDVQAAAAAARAGVETIMVFTGEDASTITPYAEKLGFTFTQVADPANEIAGRYRIVGVPTHYFIDRDGVVQRMAVGVLTRSQMDEALSGLSPAGTP